MAREFTEFHPSGKGAGDDGGWMIRASGIVRAMNWPLL
jgi:hypothetical protein